MSLHLYGQSSSTLSAYTSSTVSPSLPATFLLLMHAATAAGIATMFLKSSLSRICSYIWLSYLIFRFNTSWKRSFHRSFLSFFSDYFLGLVFQRVYSSLFSFLNFLVTSWAVFILPICAVFSASCAKLVSSHASFTFSVLESIVVLKLCLNPPRFDSPQFVS